MLSHIAFAKQFSLNMLAPRTSMPNAAAPIPFNPIWEARGSGLWTAAFDHWTTHQQLPQLDLSGLEPWLRLAYATKKRIRGYRNQWRNRTVVCVGNGPSIENTNLRLLNDAYVIGTNRAFMLLDQFQPRAFHLAIQDNLRMQELQQSISSLPFPVHIGSWMLSTDMPPNSWMSAAKPNFSYYLPKMEWVAEGNTLTPQGSRQFGFSPDPRQSLFYGCSVIFSAIQFAYYFGAKTIVCIGIDMDFSKGVNFVPGVRNIWPGFDYEKYAKPMFETFRKVLDSRGIRLINATPGGKVDELERLPLEQAIRV